MARDTLVYLLQKLGFLIYIQKSVLTPTSISEFLGFVGNSQGMTLIPPKVKILKNQKHCKEILIQPTTSIRTLSKLINKEAAICAAPMQHRPLQHD